MELSPGVYWIKDENGSSKTTLFKSLANILPAQAVLTLIVVQLVPLLDFTNPL